jgi:hypothetical protein
MSGLASPPNRRRGVAIPRALRLNLGLPVCVNPECNRAPVRRGRCRPCYESIARPGHASIGPVICTSVILPVELHQRAHAAASGTRGGLSALIREALAEKLGRL